MITNHTVSLPASGYADAMTRLAALQAREGNEVNPVCKSYALTHGHKTPRVLVYFHGFTNCPEQFRQLGQIFFERGYNVLAPRAPYHGLLDRLTPDLAKLTVADLIASTEEVVNLACGLGDEVVVAGLSGGGVMAAWAAQQRSDVALALVAAPALGLPFVPPLISEAARGAIGALPNRFIWWDPRVKEELPDCPHAYPRWPTKALGEIMRLGALLRKEAKGAAPAAQRIIMVTNDNDLAVNNRMARRLLADWRKLVGDRVQEYRFPKAQGVFHDMIDPTQSRQRIDVVYPVWLELIDGPQ
jgi:carboxylesterase